MLEQGKLSYVKSNHDFYIMLHEYMVLSRSSDNHAWLLVVTMLGCYSVGFGLNPNLSSLRAGFPVVHPPFWVG